MKNYRIESEFEHMGLKCVAIMTDMAHRCGYVGIKKNHVLYGKEYGNIGTYFDVHGGITYSGGGNRSKYPIESDLWWFGFDCAHWGDGKDFETAKKLFSDDQEKLDYIGYFEKTYENLPDGDICTKEYVENECRHLAEQLAEFGGDPT